MTRETGRIVLLLDKAEARLVRMEGEEVSADEIYALLGCDTLDCVRLDDGTDMWVDDMGADVGDDGVPQGWVNPGATLLARSFGFGRQPYFGPALVCGLRESDGASVGLTLEQALVLASKIEESRR